MKLCPFCAEEIQDAATRCKHCRSDLPAAPRAKTAPDRGSRRLDWQRWVVLGLCATATLAVAGPVVMPRLLRPARLEGCQPVNVVEWHAAMKQGCLKPSYVCEHMTTPKMLEDPDVARSFSLGPDDESPLAEMVGRMRHAYGCSPEVGPTFRKAPPSQRTPRSPVPQDIPRTL